MKKYTVLYINGSKAFSGAAKSLSVYLGQLASQVSPVILCAKGAAAQYLSKFSPEVHESAGLAKFDHTENGYYRSKRWLILLREIFFVPLTVLAILKLKKNDIDLVHANEVTDLPTALLCKWILKKPLVLHVRSRQYSEDCLRTRCQKYFLNNCVDCVIAIDETVAKTLKQTKCLVVHNALDREKRYQRTPETFYPAGCNYLRVGFVASLMQDKGIYDLIEAAVVLKKNKVPCKLFVFGENLHKNQGTFKDLLLNRLGYIKDVKHQLQLLLDRYDLEEIVEFKGFCADLTEIYSKIDVVCFPSHLDAVGRPVIEGASWGVPGIVAFRSDPGEDTFVDNQTGLAVCEGDIEGLADAIEKYVKTPSLIHEHGRQAYALAELNFNVEANARKIHDVYTGLIH